MALRWKTFMGHAMADGDLGVGTVKEGGCGG